MWLKNLRSFPFTFRIKSKLLILNTRPLVALLLHQTSCSWTCCPRQFVFACYSFVFLESSSSLVSSVTAKKVLWTLLKLCLLMETLPKHTSPHTHRKAPPTGSCTHFPLFSVQIDPRPGWWPELTRGRGFKRLPVGFQFGLLWLSHSRWGSGYPLVFVLRLPRLRMGFWCLARVGTIGVNTRWSMPRYTVLEPASASAARLGKIQIAGL